MAADIVDIEAELVAALATDHPNIGTRTPRELEANLPFLVIRRAPGSTFVDPYSKRLEAVRIELHAWDESTVDAFDEIADAIVDLSALEGTTTAAAVIGAVDITATPQPLHDPARPELFRYIATAVVHAHPL